MKIIFENEQEENMAKSLQQFVKAFGCEKFESVSFRDAYIINTLSLDEIKTYLDKKDMPDEVLEKIIDLLREKITEKEKEKGREIIKEEFANAVNSLYADENSQKLIYIKSERVRELLRMRLFDLSKEQEKVRDEIIQNKILAICESDELKQKKYKEEVTAKKYEFELIIKIQEEKFRKIYE
jgi:predicted amino acid-binding ACT domain protein